jgi:hypothetical protein
MSRMRLYLHRQTSPRRRIRGTAAGVEFIAENGGGPGVRLRKATKWPPARCSTGATTVLRSFRVQTNKYILLALDFELLGIYRNGKELIDHLGAGCPSHRVDYRRGGILVSSLALLASALLVASLLAPLASLALLASLVVVVGGNAPAALNFQWSVASAAGSRARDRRT